MKRHQLVDIALEAGDALLFHCNLLHRFERSTHAPSSSSLISVYNLASNKPYQDAAASCYRPLRKVDDDVLMESGAKTMAEHNGLFTYEKDKKIEKFE